MLMTLFYIVRLVAMYEFGVIAGLLCGLVVGYVIGHSSGHKAGRIEGARLRMSQETYASSPLSGKSDTKTLEQARKQLDKQIKPKEGKSKEPESFINSVVWVLIILILGVIGYSYL